MERLLESGDKDARLRELLAFPAKKIVGPLIKCFYSPNEQLRSAAIEGLGAVTASLYESDPEGARQVMRRLMWSLNEESGGIGWGAAEAMAEAMALSPGLAKEYANILVSYIDPEGNFLEYGPLRKGALWGVKRLAGAYPELAAHAGPHLRELLNSEDPGERSLAAEALDLLKEKA